MNEGVDAKTPHTTPHNDNYEEAINFYVKTSNIEVKLGKTPFIKADGFVIFNSSDLDNSIWTNDLKRGKIPKFISKKLADEIGTTPEEVSAAYAKAIADPKTNTATNDVNRAITIVSALKKFDDFFNPKSTSQCADRLSINGHFFSVEAPEASIERLTLYAYNGSCYTRNGEMLVAKKLEHIRNKMLATAERVHSLYDHVLKKAIQSSDEELSKTAMKALDTTPNCEIKISFRREVCTSLAARNIVKPQELNRPPIGYLFAIGVHNGILLGKLDDRKLRLEIRPFTADLLITRLLDVALNPNDIRASETAMEWFYFTQSVFGPSGVMQFYEFAGYVLIEQFPLPTERSILFMVADPGTGKGTHMSTLESIFREGTTSFYAHASPQKLCDAREHFSLQNLNDKMLVIDGDIPHGTVRDYSPVNNLFGGETIEIEKKFKDPILIAPTLKAIWASAPPLHKIKQAGGLFRRALVLQGRSATREDPKIKPKLTSPEYRDGFFLNMLIGLNWLVSQQWVFTNEPSSNEIQELMEELADSAGVFLSANFVPSEDENDWVSIQTLYERYKNWCSRKQIETMTMKTFVTAVKTFNNGAFNVEKKKIGEKRGTYICAKDVSDSDDPVEPKNHVDTPPITWEAFISRFPEIKNTVSTSHGQITHVRDEIENVKDHDHDIVCPNDTDTPQNVSGNAVFQGLREIETVSTSDSETNRVTDEEKPSSKENLTVDPVNSDVQSENEGNESKQTPITLEDGKLIIDQLLNLGYHIDPNSGPDINRRYFKIGVLAIRGLPSDKRKKLENIMQQEHFTLFNSGSMGIFWYIRPLIDGTKEGAPHD